MVRLNDSYEYEFYFGASPTTKAQATILRKNMTIAEKVLWQQLRNCQIDGLKFRRQHPVDIFIIDFYCHERKLAVEVDGGIHNEVAQKEWDENRTFELNEFGIKVLRFTNEDVIDRTRDVIKTIKEYLKL
jgi:very-short-patch-repair endonuclease